MTREILGYLANRHTLLLYAIALAVLVVGEIPHPMPPQGLLGRLLGVTSTIGFGIIVSTLVASVLNFGFQTAVHNAFAIVKGAEGARILRIFATRSEAIAPIADQAERANRHIDVLCVSGTSLLHRGCRVLKELGRRHNDSASAQIRVLILDPRSRFAVERSLREEGKGTPCDNPSAFAFAEMNLCRDTLESLRQLEKILRAPSEAHDYSCQVRLYNSAPVAMYVRIDDRAYVEPYHHGIPKAQIGSPFTKCLGKAIPVVEVSADSELGHVMQSNFDYLWQWSRNRELRSGSANQIEKSLSDINWLDRFIKLEMEERELLSLSHVTAGAAV